MNGLIDFGIIKPELAGSLGAGFRASQEERNALARQAQAQQLVDVQLRNALRGEQEAQAESEAAKGSTSLQDLALRQRQAGLAKQALATEAAISKQRTDQLTQAKTQLELMKSAANQIFTNPQNAVQVLTNFGQTSGADVSKELAQLQQLGGNPEAIKQWAAGHVIEADKMLPKFQEFSTPGGGKQLGTVDPRTGVFTATKTMAPQLSPYEQARIGQENQRLAQEATGVVYQEDANGNVIALPSKLKKGEVPVGRLAAAPGGGFQPMQAKPSEAVGKEQMSLNQQKAIVNGAMAAVKNTPTAFGLDRGMMGETIGGKFYDTPAEAEARAYVYNVVSGVIKERAGTAQSAAEKATLDRFLPSENDNAKQLEAKFTAFNKYLTDKESGTTKKRGGTVPSTPNIDDLLNKYK